MKRALIVTLLTVLCSASTIRAGIDGSVFLFPIEQGGGFASHGECVFVDTLQQVDPTVVLTGTHSVHGPQIFNHAITGNGRDGETGSRTSSAIRAWRT